MSNNNDDGQKTIKPLVQSRYVPVQRTVSTGYEQTSQVNTTIDSTKENPPKLSLTAGSYIPKSKRTEFNTNVEQKDEKSNPLNLNSTTNYPLKNTQPIHMNPLPNSMINYTYLNNPQMYPNYPIVSPNKYSTPTNFMYPNMYIPQSYGTNKPMSTSINIGNTAPLNQTPLNTSKASTVAKINPDAAPFIPKHMKKDNNTNKNEEEKQGEKKEPENKIDRSENVEENEAKTENKIENKFEQIKLESKVELKNEPKMETRIEQKIEKKNESNTETKSQTNTEQPRIETQVEQQKVEVSVQEPSNQEIQEIVKPKQEVKTDTLLEETRKENKQIESSEVTNTEKKAEKTSKLSALFDSTPKAKPVSKADLMKKSLNPNTNSIISTKNKKEDFQKTFEEKQKKLKSLKSEETTKKTYKRINKESRNRRNPTRRRKNRRV
jgi:hypothetical protein